MEHGGPIASGEMKNW